jgi:hypothetical protein
LNAVLPGLIALVPGDVVLPVPFDERPSQCTDEHVEEEHEEELPG